MQSIGELRAGRYLGRYELLMPLAQGGMASIWAARLKGTRGFQRIVAIKTLLPSLSEDARFEQMFLDEAALAARVRHANVVQVLDLGEEDGLLYQVMEWIDGEPLSAFLRELPEGRGVPFPIAARILIGAAQGLHAAHETRDESNQEVGLVHRDVSPQNILVSRDGVIKVVDFGVAKASSLSSAQTSTGTLKGKPGYMSPEQVQGDRVDRRADVFALGVLTYVLSTGHHPFRGANDMATLQRICSAEPPHPPSKYAAGYPKALEDVVLTAIAHQRTARYPSAAAFARALEAAVPVVNEVGDAEVAAFTKTLLVGQIEARNKALRRALQEADHRSHPSSPSQPNAQLPRAPQTLQGIGPSPLYNVPTTPPQVMLGELVGSTTPAPIAAPPESIFPPPPNPRVGGVLIALATAGIVIGLGLFGLLVAWPQWEARHNGGASPALESASSRAPLSDVGTSPLSVPSSSSEPKNDAISVDSLPIAKEPSERGNRGSASRASRSNARRDEPVPEPETPDEPDPPTPEPPPPSNTGSSPAIREPGF